MDKSLNFPLGIWSRLNKCHENMVFDTKQTKNEFMGHIRIVVEILNILAWKRLESDTINIWHEKINASGVFPKERSD